METKVYENYITVNNKTIIIMGFQIGSKIKQPIYSLVVGDENQTDIYIQYKIILNNSIINGQVS